MANQSYLDTFLVEPVTEAEARAILDALGVEVFNQSETRAMLDALGVEVFNQEVPQTRLDSFEIEVVWRQGGSPNFVSHTYRERHILNGRNLCGWGRFIG